MNAYAVMRRPIHDPKNLTEVVCENCKPESTDTHHPCRFILTEPETCDRCGCHLPANAPKPKAP